MSHPTTIQFILQTDNREELFGFSFDDYSAAAGDESIELKKSYSEVKEHYLKPASRRWNNNESRFYALKDEWQEQTKWSSSINEICMHPAYQQIIGMGSKAIPYIMKELPEHPHLWFWALKSITGEDPVPPHKRGRLIDMATAWILWWTQYKYQK